MAPRNRIPLFRVPWPDRAGDLPARWFQHPGRRVRLGRLIMVGEPLTSATPDARQTVVYARVWSLPALRKAWNATVGRVLQGGVNTGLDALARGLKNWTDSRSGKRRGRPVGFPRFESRRRTTPSVRFTTGAVRVTPDRMHVALPRLNPVEAARSVLQDLPGTATPPGVAR